MAIIVPIIADTSGLTRGLSKSQSGLKRFGKIAAGVAGAAALGGLVATVKVGIDEFMEAQKVLAQTGAVLKSTGGAANVTAAQISTLSTSLMRMTGIDDEAIQSGQNLLLTFTKIRNETGKGNDIFNQATLAMTNLSVAMGKDLNSSAILVGKALNNPIKGMGALSKAGVQFTEGQKATIESLVDSGNVMGAQKIILKELETQFGGSAAAAGKTLPGQLNILKQTFSNLAGELVGGFLPILGRAAQKLVGFLDEFRAQPNLNAKISFVISSIKDAVGNSFSSLLSWWTTSKTEIQRGKNNEIVVVVVPSGAEKAQSFLDRVFGGAYKRGEDFGNKFTDGLIAWLTGNGKGEIGASITNVFGKLGKIAEVLSAGQLIAVNFMLGITDGIIARGSEIAQALMTAIRNAISSLPGSLKRIADEAFGFVQGPLKRLGPAFKRGFAVIISDPIKEAVASARSSLAGLGSSLGEMLSKITGATSPEAKEAAAIRKRQKAERKAREEKALRDALASAETVEDRERAQLELDDWLEEEEAQRLEGLVADRQAADALSIDNLITEFNRGLIGFEEFSSRLDGIIGTDRGTELGIAFADGFSSAVSALTTTVQSIVAGVGGVQAPTGTEVAGAQSGQQEKENAYQKAVRQYNADRAARLKRAEDYRKRADSRAGSRIDPGERAEIHAIMAEWDRNNKMPTRSAFGLARGGILKQPTFVAGEAGREAVIPLESSSAMKILRDAIGGGGGSTVVYNLVVNAGLGTDPDDLGRTIVESIKRYEKRNGAVFQGPIVTTLANAAGKTSTASAATDFNRAKTLRSG